MSTVDLLGDLTNSLQALSSDFKTRLARASERREWIAEQEAAIGTAFGQVHEALVRVEGLVRGQFNALAQMEAAEAAETYGQAEGGEGGEPGSRRFESIMGGRADNGGDNGPR